jgi:hypothetical protein
MHVGVADVGTDTNLLADGIQEYSGVLYLAGVFEPDFTHLSVILNDQFVHLTISFIFDMLGVRMTSIIPILAQILC